MLWIQTVDMSIRAWDEGDQSPLGDGAWLRLTQRFEQMEGRRPRVRLRHP
jgi:hypothetical protein